MNARREYAAAGVDYGGKINPFKATMVEMGKRTQKFPEARSVGIRADGSFEYLGKGRPRWRQITEGLGNKNWIAEWMYEKTRDPDFFSGIGMDTMMMAVVDLLCWGALPVVYTDEIAAGTSDWFADRVRAAVIVESFYEAAYQSGVAIVGGESSALRYLVKAVPPVADAPIFSGCATGIYLPDCQAIEGRIWPGQEIIGARSSGLHASGISLVIKRALELTDQFLKELPNGNTLGAEALIPSECYVRLVEELVASGADVAAIVPATGEGVAKLLRYPRYPCTYRIAAWPEVPLIFQFMRELGVSVEECLRTFNWGIGLYLFVNPVSAERVCDLGRRAGFELLRLGRVEEGERKVIFGPERDLVLLPE